jgi:hypothetical protein
MGRTVAIEALAMATTESSLFEEWAARPGSLPEFRQR